MPKAKITAHPMWELDRINVFLDGIDSENECTFFVPSRPLLFERSNPHRGTFEHGFATHGNLDLTIEQAENLANELLNAAQAMRDMDHELEEYERQRQEEQA